MDIFFLHASTSVVYNNKIMDTLSISPCKFQCTQSVCIWIPYLKLHLPCLLFQKDEITAFLNAASQGDLEVIREFIEVRDFPVDKEDEVQW